MANYTYYYCRGCGYAYTESVYYSRVAGANRTSVYKAGPIELVKKIMPHAGERESETCSFDLKNKVCHVCGEKVVFIDSTLLNEQGTGIYGIPKKEKARISDEIEKFVKQVKEEAEKKKSISQISSDSVDLKTFLQHLIAIETHILSLSQRLIPLSLAQLETQQAFTRTRIQRETSRKDNTRVAIEQVKQEIAKLQVKYPIIREEVKFWEVGVAHPEKPVFKSYNIFNKRRIMQENEEAQKEYDRKLSEFNKEFEQKKEEELLRRRAVNAENKAKADQERAVLSARIQELENAPIELYTDVEEARQLLEKCTAEVTEVQEKIRELCDARVKFHNCGIIYPKYLDFIALTTIYEYLITGRCTELTGPDGAYNLYESEIRANRVIAQLDKVVNALEDIKANQYYTYTLLSDMNKEIQGLSEQLSAITKITGRIEENSSFIAYNTSKIAHYSKVNAELTNALGFLIALK